MTTLKDILEENINDKEELTQILISFDHMLEMLHNNGLYVYNFDPSKIIMYEGKFLPQSFNQVVGHIGDDNNRKILDLYQAAKIGLMAYNNRVVDGNMNQEYFDFIKDNLDQFNQSGVIPEEIFEYYGELFQRLNVVYLNKYLIEKRQEASANQNANVMRKSLSTEIGRAYVGEENNKAYVDILFIPSILVLLYFICLLIYIFFIK